jgi:phospholipase/carboxylesterase
VSLGHRTRAAAAEPEGALVLFHGRGADEDDLFPLLDVLDPERRLTGYTPRGPLSLPPGGAHWYVVREVGYPDPATFLPTYAAAAEWLDGLELPWERTVLGGFSQGAVMSYALALGAGRPRPAGVLALSGFVPDVEGFDLDLSPPLPRFALGHGTYDPVIEVGFGRRAHELLAETGADVIYRESPLPHAIDPRYLVELRSWLVGTIPRWQRSSSSTTAAPGTTTTSSSG